MAESVSSFRLVRFGIYEVDLQTGELRKAGVKLKLGGQPFQVLAILLEHPGDVFSREELQKRLWPDTFVDVDHNLNTAINKIREVLGDSSESPRFVETLPRRGYRFIAPVERQIAPLPQQQKAKPSRPSRIALLITASLVLLIVASGLYKLRQSPVPPVQRTLTRLTFDDGLQIGATWSPDGRFIAYSSDRGGKFDIWVQQVSGGDPIQITKGPGQNWQPNWSPDGKYIAYRSEVGYGGLYIIPALGGLGLEQKIASFGYFPQWSPDGAQILFGAHFFGGDYTNQLYVVGIDGHPPRELFATSSSHGAVLKGLNVFSAAWHPDGKRITFSALNRGPGPSFWTIPIDGGSLTKLEIPAGILKQIAAEGSIQINSDWKFAWNPSGTAIYFCRKFRGISNLWRMTVDPLALKAVSVERLTTGSGLDADLAISRDGENLAFTAKSSLIRTWLSPFDANRGTVSGTGQAVTPVGIEAWYIGLSPDGKRLAFFGSRGGKIGLWEKHIDGGPETPVVADDSHGRYLAQWSPDSNRLAYWRENLSTGDGQIVTWSGEDHSEVPVTLPSSQGYAVSQWAPDGKSLLSWRFSDDKPVAIWQVPLGTDAQVLLTPRMIISDSKANLYQANFSPDGRWIVFLSALVKPEALELTVYVTPASGGKWIRITDGKHWDDKPRWSPDGKIIYFVSNRGGFFNVWGLHFDPVRAQVVGDAFQVTSYNRPSLMIPTDISQVELSLGRGRLAVTVEQASGSIWVMNNADR